MSNHLAHGVIQLHHGGMSTKAELILLEIKENNPLRRGFIGDAQEDIMLFLKGESNDVRQLTCRLAHKILELFELDDCEVVPVGVCPDGKISWALVRIQLQESSYKLQENEDETDN
jgi:hypothetical protein